MALEFDPQLHTYRLHGRRLPSVTEVLKPLEDFSMVSRDVLIAAAEFGKHVHQACDLFNRGTLDWFNLDPSLLPYVDAWRRFIHESGAVVIASESPVYHELMGYAGTPDVVLSWGKREVVPDIKSTAAVPRTVGAQTAAYAKAWHAMHGGKEPARYCIQLLPDGTYRSHARRDPGDWSLFISCLNVYKFKEKHHVAA